MARGRIAVIIPEVYDTLVFTGVSTGCTDSYAKGENNIYELPFLSELTTAMLS